MNKNVIMTLVIGLVVGIGGTLGVSAISNSAIKETPNTKQTMTDHKTMSMVDMNSQLESLSGDAFDEAFIAMMIAHHEGAVDMAKLSDTRAKHDEIKQLSQAIIIAQKKEITDMKQWQMDWDYITSDNSMPGMNH